MRGPPKATRFWIIIGRLDVKGNNQGLSVSQTGKILHTGLPYRETLTQSLIVSTISLTTHTLSPPVSSESPGLLSSRVGKSFLRFNEISFLKSRSPYLGTVTRSVSTQGLRPRPPYLFGLGSGDPSYFRLTGLTLFSLNLNHCAPS